MRLSARQIRASCGARSTPSAASSRRGASLYRYRDEDGLPGQEGCFVACSFWLVEALARRGRRDEATRADGGAAPARQRRRPVLRGDRPRRRGDFLGNFPQGLVHLALINAAATLAEESAP